MGGGGSYTPVLQAFRWYDDDSSDLDAQTALDTQGTNITLATTAQAVLRVRVGETGGKNGPNTAHRFQYRKNTGTWTDLTTTSADCRLFDGLAANLTAIDGTTNIERLTGGGGAYDSSGGYYIDTSNTTTAGGLAADDRWEMACCVELVHADVADTDTIEFRVRDAAGSTFTDTAVPTITVSKSAAANLDQSDFRAENNDGSESGSTFRAAENTNWTDSPDRHIRVRFAVEENGGVNGSITAPTLYYNKNSGGWNAVTTSSSNVQALGTTGSRHLTDHGASTQRITAAGTFTAGTVDDNDGALPTKSINANNYTNFVFSFYIIPGDVADGDTIQLRVQDGATALDAYTQTPTITVAKAPSFALTNFRFRNDDGSETTATWREDASMPAVFAPGNEFRLRGLVSAGAADQTIQGFVWQYSKNKGTWTNLTNSTSADIYVFDSTNLTAYTGTTTQQLGSGTFRTGITVDTDVLTDKDIAFLGSDESEFEVALKLHATNNSAGDFYDFRAIPIDPGDASNSVIVSTDSMPLLVVTTAGTELVKAFQEGVVPTSYTGAQDATIIENTPGTGDNSSLLGFDGDDPVSSGLEKRALVEWDISDVPSNATVVDALITGYVANAWTPGYDTVENTSSWTDSTVNWTGRPSQTATNLCSIGPTMGGLRPISNDFNTTGIAVIQDWVDGTDTTNDGFSIQEGATATDGGNIASDSESVTGRRPRLTIIYTAATDVVVNQTSSVALTMATQAADVNAETIVDQAAEVSLTMATNQADVNASSVVDATEVALTMTGQQADVNAETSIDQTAPVSLTMAGQTAEVSLGVIISQASPVSLTMASNAADVNASAVVDATEASLTMSTNQADVNAETSIDATAVALTMSANQADVNAEVSIDASTASLTMTAHAATITLVESVEEPTGGGVSLAELERQRKYNQAEKARREKVEPKRPKPKKKTVETYTLDNRQFKLTKEDMEWVRESIDKPWQPPSNELLLREIHQRKLLQERIALENIELERAMQAHIEFMQDEEEAIALILTQMI